MTQYFEKSKREMTQDVLKVLFGNASILLKVLTDFDTMLSERVMPQYFESISGFRLNTMRAGFDHLLLQSISGFQLNILSNYKWEMCKYFFVKLVCAN